jgi:hypothetical protein
MNKTVRHMAASNQTDDCYHLHYICIFGEGFSASSGFTILTKDPTDPDPDELPVPCIFHGITPYN